LTKVIDFYEMHCLSEKSNNCVELILMLWKKRWRKK